MIGLVFETEDKRIGEHRLDFISQEAADNKGMDRVNTSEESHHLLGRRWTALLSHHVAASPPLAGLD